MAKAKQGKTEEQKLREFERNMISNLLDKSRAGRKLSTDDWAFYKEWRHKLRGDENGDGKFSVSEAAEYIRKSRRTIYYHIKKGNIKQQRDGMILKKDLDLFLETDKWRETERSLEEPGPEEKGPSKRELADLRYREARADYQELLTKRERAELVSREDSLEMRTEGVLFFRRWLEIVRMRLVNRLGIRSRKKLKELDLIIKEEFDRGLDLISKAMEGK